MINYSDVFAENLRNYRKAMCLTQAQLAERIGYSEKAVSKWELGGSIPHIDTLILLAETFNVSLDDLFEHSTEPSYYLGIDGGATKTAFALANAEGNIISEITLGPSNPIDLGFDAACAILSEGSAKITSSIRKKKISLFAGIAGGGIPDVKEKFRVFFENFGFLRSDNGSDAENIIAAGLSGEDGAIIIMGTGSSCFVSRGGVSERIGGYGYLFDHGGSGYDLGNSAIRVAMQMEDGSGPCTRIREIMLERTGLPSMLESVSYFYSLGKRGIASFSPVVFEAYDLGDEVAKRILEENASHIANLAMTAEKKLDSCDTVKIALVGGLTSRWDVLGPMVMSCIAENEVQKSFDFKVFKGNVVRGALMRAGAPIV